MSDLIARLMALETEIHYREPPPAGEPEFTYVAGQLPILLSAPHGTAHMRNGKIKDEDEYTSSFARLVAEQSGAHVLYVHHRSDTDPNYDQNTPYKKCLKRLIKTAKICFVLDIHGASPHRDFGIALGTMYGRACPANQRELIIRTLNTHGFRRDGPIFHPLDRLDVDNVFPGGAKQHTITRYVSQHLHVPAAQFEINAYLRAIGDSENGSEGAFRGNRSRISKTVKTFVALVLVLAGQA